MYTTTVKTVIEAVICTSLSNAAVRWCLMTFFDNLQIHKEIWLRAWKVRKKTFIYNSSDIEQDFTVYGSKNIVCRCVHEVSQRYNFLISLIICIKRFCEETVFFGLIDAIDCSSFLKFPQQILLGITFRFSKFSLTFFYNLSNNIVMAQLFVRWSAWELQIKK